MTAPTFTQAEAERLADGERYRTLCADINGLISTAWRAEITPRGGPQILRRWDDQTHAALMLRLIDLMKPHGITYWQYGDLHVYRYHPPISEGDEICAEFYDECDESLPSYPPAAAEWTNAWYGVFADDDPDYAEQVNNWISAELVAAEGGDAGHCLHCNGPAWYEDWYDLDRCPHCGAPAVSCALGCYDVGTPGHCMHHGAPAVPPGLLDAFRNDAESASAWLNAHGGLDAWQSAAYWHDDTGDIVNALEYLPGSTIGGE